MLLTYWNGALGIRTYLVVGNRSLGRTQNQQLICICIGFMQLYRSSRGNIIPRQIT